MNRTPQESPRRLIPRWRSYYRTVRAGEMTYPYLRRSVIEHDTSELTAKVAAFAQNPNPITAVELVAAGAVFDVNPDPTYLAATSLLAQPTVAPAIKLLAERLASPPENTSIADTNTDLREIVRIMRRLLRGHERNPHLWVDLALIYTIQGQYRPAERAIKIALAFAPYDRFVLRAAVRFYVQIEQPDKGHALLAKNAASPNDPWLIAAEISVADKAGINPRFVKPGRSILASANHSERELAELTAALGTLELESGNRRGASKLFRQSLVNPTANALAQAAWAHYALPGINIDGALSQNGEGWEAKALQDCEFGVWGSALHECRRWVDDEPFSPRAANMGNFAAGMSGDHRSAESFARKGLSLNPGSNVLKNNLAVSLATLNQVSDAVEVFRTVTVEDDNPASQGVRVATAGLIAFRAGFTDEGRQLYRNAINWMEARNQKSMAARALAYLAREEIVARTEVADATLREAMARMRTLTANEKLVIQAVLDPTIKESRPDIEIPPPIPKIVLPPFLSSRYPNLVLE